MRPAAKVALFLSGLLLVLVPGLASGLLAAAPNGPKSATFSSPTSSPTKVCRGRPYSASATSSSVTNRRS
ncbi:hypothetical protein KBZ21_41425, partial [Streptomyces sp. A73]|nr:hypothetical protein [Streptomyces sp. A73]